jgi:hypothetical protein
MLKGRPLRVRESVSPNHNLAVAPGTTVRRRGTPPDLAVTIPVPRPTLRQGASRRINPDDGVRVAVSNRARGVSFGSVEPAAVDETATVVQHRERATPIALDVDTNESHSVRCPGNAT